MTPKEKAKELVDKFYQTTPNECWINQPLEFKEQFKEQYKAWKQSKQCALIAVEEILKDKEEIDGMRIINDPYWLEVKQEIEKL